MTTSFLGKPGLLRMVGAGDEDHIITRVLPGTDPLQELDEDDPQDIITTMKLMNGTWMTFRRLQCTRVIFVCALWIPQGNYTGCDLLGYFIHP